MHMTYGIDGLGKEPYSLKMGSSNLAFGISCLIVQHFLDAQLHLMQTIIKSYIQI